MRQTSPIADDDDDDLLLLSLISVTYIHTTVGMTTFGLFAFLYLIGTG
jgi:hypothetical protein